MRMCARDWSGIDGTVATMFHTGVKAEALRAKIYRKSAISHQRSHLDPKFQVQGVAPTNNFCTIS